MPCGSPTLRRAIIGGRRITYELHRSPRRRKSVTLHVEGDRFRVLAPLRTPVKQIEGWVAQRESWIAERIAMPRQSGLRVQLKDGGQLPLLGSPYPVEAGPFLFAFDGERFLIDDRDPVRFAAAEHWFREFARDEFADRVEQWSGLVGASPTKIQVRNQKTRWGSASSRGTLSFNWRLMFAKPEIINYVVVHELCHLIRPDHSPAYWKLVASHLPDYKAQRQALKDIGNDLSW